MSASKAVKDLKRLLTKTTINKSFTNLIRNNSELFWSKPMGTSEEFHEAFHSPKTNPALRYVMGISGILGEEDALNRSLRNLNSQLHFKVEPQYSKKGGRLRLSHFVVKGYDRSGHGQFLKINHVAKKMMMGTPTEAGRTRLATSAISGKTKRVPKKYKQEVLRKIQEAKEHKEIEKYVSTHIAEARKQLRQTSNKAKSKAETRKQQKEAHSTQDIQQLIDPNIPPEAVLPTSTVQPNDIWDVYLNKEKKEQEKRVKNKLKAERRTATIKARKDMSEAMAARHGFRKMTAEEKARILKALIEISKHLQGIMWVLHYTVKLNDKRRHFLYIDGDFVWVGNIDGTSSAKLDLYGFPQHMLHYINEHKLFSEWFDFLGVEKEAQRLLNQMQKAQTLGEQIDGVEFSSEDEMQDAVDELLEECSYGLKLTTALYDKIMKSDWIFSAPIDPTYYKVPKTVPRHSRHPASNKRFQPETTRKKANKAVTAYKRLHADYWEKKFPE